MKESAAFGWVGKVLAFIPGEKSPVQYLSMQVVAADSGTAPALSPRIEPEIEPKIKSEMESSQKYAIALSKSVRQMMLGYLSPDDWIRVVGKRKFDGKTGDWQWKAKEIVKLSATQIDHYRTHHYRQALEKSADLDSTRRGTRQPTLQKISGTASRTVSGQTSSKTSSQTRVLICQKSSCQRRGSVAVCQAMERAIAQNNHPHGITLQAIGCMKQCKSGLWC
ncbi:MAG: (2Fe-2S) ferredoxin domain-containing protein [Bacteroidota bacterium]